MIRDAGDDEIFVLPGHFLPGIAGIVRVIPVVANARIPGRAMVMVYLASAILAAVGFAVLREHGRHRLALGLGCLAVLGYAPAFPPRARKPTFHLKVAPSAGCAC